MAKRGKVFLSNGDLGESATTAVAVYIINKICAISYVRLPKSECQPCALHYFNMSIFYMCHTHHYALKVRLHTQMCRWQYNEKVGRREEAVKYIYEVFFAPAIFPFFIMYVAAAFWKAREGVSGGGGMPYNDGKRNLD
jgi:hypothetical protein